MIYINLDKARNIAHSIRRNFRQEELAPLDAQIYHHIANPQKQLEIDAQRQVIRDKYAAMQDQIDSAETVSDLKDIIKK